MWLNINIPFHIPRILPLNAKGCWWFPIYRDEIFDALRWDRPFEERELKFIQSFLKSGQSFWDIGANFGLYTVLAAKRVGPEGYVLAVEPDPKNLSRLKRNIWLNRLKVEVIPFALGECEEIVEFCSCSAGAYSGLKTADVPGEFRKITVQKTTLDLIAEKREWPEVHLMKIDVEGAERLTILGGRKFFRELPRPIVLAEFCDKRSESFGCSSSEVYELLFEEEYRWFAFADTGKLIPQPKKPRYDYNNLVGCPIEKIKSLASWIDD